MLFWGTFNNCTDDLIVSQVSNHHSIDELLMCLKRKVVLEYIFKQNYQLEYFNIGYHKIYIWPFSGYDVDKMWFVTPHPPTQTRYIACGNRFFDNNAHFNIFFASFRTEIWITIAVIFFLIVPLQLSFFSMLMGFNANISVIIIFLQNMFGVGKIFLDQSSVLASKNIGSNSVRILAGLTLVCALVLSNTYKNDNMYEMMLPQTFKPLHFFKQLLRFKFVVYSLPDRISVKENVKIDSLNKSTANEVKSLGRHRADIMVQNIKVAGFQSSFLTRNSELHDTKTKLFEFVCNNSDIWTTPLYNLKVCLLITDQIGH